MWDSSSAAPTPCAASKMYEARPSVIPMMLSAAKGKGTCQDVADNDGVCAGLYDAADSQPLVQVISVFLSAQDVSPNDMHNTTHAVMQVAALHLADPCSPDTSNVQVLA